MYYTWVPACKEEDFEKFPFAPLGGGHRIIEVEKLRESHHK